ncbi:MAG: hypothetical protein IPH94_16235 [Saprospiraceae bacterium]|nr:hypothetical protein [Saprospiraceae bacterium]
MYQEYRDWEKAFQKQTADENANIDTNKLWDQLKVHVPAKSKQNRWLPFLLILGLLSLCLPAWLWKQNVNLKATNKSLAKELSDNKVLLLECRSLAQNYKNLNAQFSGPSHLVSSDSRNHEQKKSISQNVKNFSKSTTTNIEDPSQHFIQQIEETPQLYSLREAVVVNSIEPRKMSVTEQAQQIIIPIKKYYKKSSVAQAAGFVKLAFIGGGSDLKGNYLSSDLVFVNNVNYQLGLQLNAAKYLNRKWFVGAQLSYLQLGNVSNFTLTTKDRNETTGTTQIVIDASGNITSSEGIKGTTSYHRVKAELYNVHHQILIGPGLGYTFLQSDKVKVNFYASAQWMLSSQFSGKAPLGSESLTAGETQQWLYKLSLPQLGFGADWNQQLTGKLYLSLGLHTGFQTDQLSKAGMMLSRKGFFYSGQLGLQKYF